MNNTDDGEKAYKVYEITGEVITEWGNWYETRDPVCDYCGEILEENPNLKYCPYCNAKLDWSEYDI